MKYQNFATGSGHILIPFIIGIGVGWGTDTRILLQTFLVGMRDHFSDTERGTSLYEVFLNTLVATSWNAFAGDIDLTHCLFYQAIQLSATTPPSRSSTPISILA